MTKRSHPGLPPPVPGRGMPSYRGGMFAPRDPFYVFKRIARDNGKPYKPPEPKAEQELLSWLSGKAALVVMGCLLAAVVVALLVVVAVKL
jgi:hypothetical protein